MSTTNILDLNNRIDALEKIFHNVEPIQQQIDVLKAWTYPGTKDASGNPIILTDGTAFKAEGLVVTLEPKQSGSGTPSPENVRPITGYTECVVTVKDEDDTTQDTATIAFGQTVYGGSVDFKTGKVTVDRVCKIFDGSEDENWGLDGNGKRVSIKLNDAKPGTVEASPPGLISNLFITTTSSVTYTGNIGISIDNYKWLGVSDGSGAMTVASWKTYLASNNLQVAYELATPTELTLTPAELELLKGYNYINTNGTNIELTYQPDTLKADILLTVSQLYGSKISIFDGILTGGDTGQVLTKTSDDNYDATWATLPATRTTTKKSEK